MDLVTARRHIVSAFERMRVSYLQPVFNEWAIISLSPKDGGIVDYEGPRRETFRQLLAQDAEPLRVGTKGKEFADGDIEFVADADGTRYDGFIKTGPASYLVLNHTHRKLSDIRADEKWLGAQAALFDLSEKFRADPLEM